MGTCFKRKIYNMYHGRAGERVLGSRELPPHGASAPRRKSGVCRREALPTGGY